MTNWIKRKVAQELRYIDDEVARSFSALRPTVKYQPEDWELEGVEDRISFYADLGALPRFQRRSRDQAVALILSLESILRRRGYVAFARKKDYWFGKISDRIPTRLLDRLVDLGFLVEEETQIACRPMVYRASDEFLAEIPKPPDNEVEGKLISDKPWKPVEVKKSDYAWSVDPVFQQHVRQMIDLNQWFQDNAHRIEGVDDLRFHRIFQHDLNQGGRIYGQFTGMDRNKERPLVRIDGEETEEADLNGSYLAFILLLSGESVPDDPYQHGELARYNRDLVKAVLTRLFGRSEWWSTKLPQTIHDQKAALGYPAGLPGYRDLRDAIIATYPSLAELEDNLTFRCERYESEALLRTLDWLREQGEIGLPIHDGIRVRKGILDATQANFHESRDQVTRAAIPNVLAGSETLPEPANFHAAPVDIPRQFASAA